MSFYGRVRAILGMEVSSLNHRKAHMGVGNAGRLVHRSRMVHCRDTIVSNQDIYTSYDAQRCLDYSGDEGKGATVDVVGATAILRPLPCIVSIKFLNCLGGSVLPALFRRHCMLQTV